MTLKVVGFPQATEFNKRIPKQKFYENLDISPALRRVFVDQIRLVYWRNKLAASTLNIAAGEAVAEIEVFEVRLNEPQLDEAVLKQIDKEIPYHMKYKLLKDLYDCFCTPPELQAQKQEIDECHQALSKVLGKLERRLVLQIIDAKDRIAEETSIDSFIAGFELAWKLSVELNHYENERSVSCQTAMGSGARFASKEEEK